MTATLEAARAYVAAGLSVIPIRADGSKAPDGGALPHEFDERTGLGKATWKPFQQRLPTDAELLSWFNIGSRGLAVIGGVVSGHLEVLDFDDAKTFDHWATAVSEMDWGLLQRLPVVYTPALGRHVYYRCPPPGGVEGNQKLACALDDHGRRTTLAETRGEGGYVLAPGCPPQCHSAGGSYHHAAGPPLTEVPSLTADERDLLLGVARSLDRLPAPAHSWDRPRQEGPAAPVEPMRPGDAYALATPWEDILGPAGWVHVRQTGGLDYWRRPGKVGNCWSATTGVRSECGRDLLVVFSSNAGPFEPGPGKGYSKFAAFTMLQHGGDYRAAAASLAARGFGEQRPGQSQSPPSGGTEGPPRNGNGSSQPPLPPECETITLLAADIPPRQIEWLWPGRIPLGKLTTFAGVGGLGKTFVLLDVCAKVSRGADWPDSHGECSPAGNVLFITGEDDPDDTLVPRLIELGADLNRIRFLKPAFQDAFQLGHLGTLNRAMEEFGAEVARLVVIDPPTAFLGGIDDHKNAELRGLLAPLKTWANHWRVALAFITHLNKVSARVDAMMRVSGSVAWVNAVRAAHLFVRDPDDHERRLFLPLKLNLGPERKGLAYRIHGTERLARVEWLGDVDWTADEAVSPRQAADQQSPRSQAASAWLVDRFRERRSWSSEELFRRAVGDGISRNAVFEAKRALDLPRAHQITAEDGSRTFEWWVPDDWGPLQEGWSPP